MIFSFVTDIFLKFQKKLVCGLYLEFVLQFVLCFWYSL